MWLLHAAGEDYQCLLAAAFIHLWLPVMHRNTAQQAARADIMVGPLIMVMHYSLYVLCEPSCGCSRVRVAQIWELSCLLHYCRNIGNYDISISFFMTKWLGKAEWRAHLVAGLQQRPVPAGVGDPETVHDYLRARMARNAQRTRQIQRLQEPPGREATTTSAKQLCAAGSADGSELQCTRTAHSDCVY